MEPQHRESATTRAVQGSHEGTRRVVSRDLVELGRALVETLASECAAGRRVPQLQLLASPFYEAIKREIARTPASESGKIGALSAAADQCRRVATYAVTPATVVLELRAAVAMLSAEPSRTFDAPYRVRPRLRLIRGGLA